MNEFAKDLKYSHSQEENSMWATIYRNAFPDMIDFHSVRSDGQHQRAGIDRIVVLESSRCIKIDEKVRRKDYGDILVEYVSCDHAGTPGWAEKALLCDYIAYAIEPSKICYMLPVVQLQQAWATNKEDWLNEYGRKSAPNPGYNTLNCPVPVNVLFRALGQQLRVRW